MRATRAPYLARLRSVGAGSAATQKLVRVAAMSAVLGSGLFMTGFREGIDLTKDMGEATAKPNPFAEAKLYVDPTSNARRTADSWRGKRETAARVMAKIAEQPQADWVGDWSGDPKQAVNEVVSRVTKSSALPVLVAYNIPDRDCGLYSKGGAVGADRYRSWIRGFADGLKGRRAVVIVEPDAVAAGCLKGAAEAERMSLIRDAVQVLKSKGATVYVDAGNPGWLDAAVMADRLQRAGVAQADGFALNVSNFYRNAENIAYGERISRLIGGKHFVIDTSRNGKGSAGGAQWCNPDGRALGTNPTAATGHALVDAFLWIKRPGESDGACAGAPPAGRWWPEYALGLAQRQTP